ncbi:MAG: hypothetical protein D6735_03505 [Acidobacteria bacterium]|nr:MAG: hypothetical protein D6735_03505 [Acidobacteriota bacterium]
MFSSSIGLSCRTYKIRNLFHIYLTRENEVVLLFPFQYNYRWYFPRDFESSLFGPGSEYIILPENAPRQPLFIRKTLHTRVFKLNEPKLSELSRPLVVSGKAGFKSTSFNNSPIFSGAFDGIDSLVVTGANLRKIREDKYANILSENHKIKDYLIDIILTFNNLVLDFEDAMADSVELRGQFERYRPSHLIDLRSRYSWARTLNINTPLIVNYTATPAYTVVNEHPYFVRQINRRNIPRFYLYKVEKVQNVDAVFNRRPQWRTALVNTIYYNYYYWVYPEY